MSKLPANFVKKPTFDSPLRRTDGPELSVVETTPEPALEIAAAVPEVKEGAALVDTAIPDAHTEVTKPMAVPMTSSKVATNTTRRRPKKSKAAEVGELACRTTLRLSSATHEALDTECYRRRMLGERITIAELAREIIDGWTKKHRR